MRITHKDVRCIAFVGPKGAFQPTSPKYAYLSLLQYDQRLQTSKHHARTPVGLVLCEREGWKARE